jgi:TPR repeat protein
MNMRTKTPKYNPSEIGQNLFYGISVRKNYRKAFPYLLDAAGLGFVHAQNLVGYCYDLGLGVEQSKSAALFWYRHAAKFNHREALWNLALKYKKGDGVAVNQKKAFSFLKKAAELGDAPAQCSVALRYLEGLGTKQDLSQSIEWMRKAARNGYASAQYNLATSYLDGEGVKANRRHARVWFEKAAKQGHKKAIAAIRHASEHAIGADSP